MESGVLPGSICASGLGLGCVRLARPELRAPTSAGLGALRPRACPPPKFETFRILQLTGHMPHQTPPRGISSLLGSSAPQSHAGGF